MHDILTVLGHQHGFGIQFADDGMDELRLAEQNDIDLILLDLSLPGMTGFDICRRLRGAGVEIPIIMVSASADPVDVVVGLEIGADDYITKPFEVRELAARVNAKLRRHRLAGRRPAAGERDGGLRAPRELPDLDRVLGRAGPLFTRDAVDLEEVVVGRCAMGATASEAARRRRG